MFRLFCIVENKQCRFAQSRIVSSNHLVRIGHNVCSTSNELYFNFGPAHMNGYERHSVCSVHQYLPHHHLRKSPHWLLCSVIHYEDAMENLVNINYSCHFNAPPFSNSTHIVLSTHSVYYTIFRSLIKTDEPSVFGTNEILTCVCVASALTLFESRVR